jgi:lysozyme
MLNWFKNLFKKKVVVIVNESLTGSFPDISHYEHCNFSVFSGKDLITKATEGSGFIDNTLETIVKGCKEKGIRLGVYHFYRCNIDPIVQAKYFISVVGLDNLETFYHEPILDYETTNGQTELDLKNNIPNMKIFMKYIEAAVGRRPIFYANLSSLRRFQLDESFTKYKLWIAHPGSEPTDIAPWKNYWAWQYSFEAFFPGIGKCDGNKFYV